MIVFDLQCSAGHVFEAWFASSTAFEEQKGRGLLACPTCGDGLVSKAVMAPAVAPKGNQRGERLPAPVPAAADAEPPASSRQDVASLTPAAAEALRGLVRQLAEAQAKALEKSSWVGDAFADKARAMHYGEEPHAPIHGVTDPGEARALIEEGIAVAPLPLPVIPPEERN